MPRSIDFVALSFFIYYDLGFALEAAGIKYESTFFPSFFDASESDQILAIFLLIVAPWILRMGYAVSTREIRRGTPRSRIGQYRELSFYISFLVICLIVSVLSLHTAFDASSIWSARSHIGEVLGPYIIVLYVPLGILSFFVTTRESHTLRGKLFTASLVLFSIASTIGAGERTLVILPLLLVFVFGGQISFTKIIGGGAAVIMLSVLLLPIFKIQFAESKDLRAVAADVANGDLSRAPVLIESIKEARFLGTKVMGYPGAGYWYSALLYVPRSLAPIKGVSTATVFTGRVTNHSIEGLDWGFGIGALDELLLNFGWLLLVPGLLLCGCLLGAADRASTAIPMLVIPGSLSAIWFLGYDLSAVLQLFGTLAIVGSAWHLLFADTGIRVRSPRLVDLVITANLDRILGHFKRDIHW
ncbi:MAG: hypothetical protein ABI383_03815 [Acidobacteriaceae bacterium]